MLLRTHAAAAPIRSRRLAASAWLLWIAAQLTAGAALAQAPVRWSTEVGGNGHWYQRVTSASDLDWREAESAARATGGDLVSISSTAEQAWVYETIVAARPPCASAEEPGGPIWIGLLQDPYALDYLEPLGGWRWSSGESIEFTNWRSGQPDDGDGGSGFGGMDAGGRWFDLPDGAATLCSRDFIIEWSLDCDGDGQVDKGEILSDPRLDCDGNGLLDACELHPSSDLDDDRVLDACERAFGDLDLDDDVDALDLAMLLAVWGTSDPAYGDFDGDGVVGALDLSIVLARWSAPPPWLAPSIDTVSPNVGARSGGTIVTISGANLSGATAVSFGGVPATDVRVTSASAILATTPPGNPGPTTITVVTPSGTATLAGSFSVVEVPTITSVFPASGPTEGGTPITIVGSGFVGVTSVSIGGSPATSVTVVNASTITAVTSASSPGPQQVSVATPDVSASLADGFVYLFFQPWASVQEGLPDPSVVVDPAIRAAIIATGYPWRVVDNATRIEMLLVPPGSFDMGCSPSADFGCDLDESPEHAVTITRPFYVGRFETMQAEWQGRMGANPSFHQGPDHPDASVRPVEQVSWNEVREFMDLTGLRLPTEAEWEFACRAGSKRAFHAMPGHEDGFDLDDLAPGIAWFDENSEGHTRRTGTRFGNAFGLHDVSGNVWEWTNDFYLSDFYDSTPSIDPQGPEVGDARVIRGGAWDTSTEALRSSNRSRLEPSERNASTGFRVARDVVVAPPVIASVSPSFGPTSGGTTLVITGANLGTTSLVSIGGVAATFSVVNASTIHAISPAGTAGPRAVTVATSGGTALVVDAFTYMAYPNWATVIEGVPNPAVVTDPALLSAIAATGLPWRVRDNATQIEMLLVPAGSFPMGCSASPLCSSVNWPRRTVTITTPFYLGRYETTQLVWTAVMGSNPSHFQGFADSSARPVEMLSWNTIQTFMSSTGLRLPTEAEWEYACRAGTARSLHSMPGYPLGTNDWSLSGNIGWSNGNSGFATRPVGQRFANALGFHDMCGNVSEWVSDFYGSYATAGTIDPTGPSAGTARVRRGGSWLESVSEIRSDVRFWSPPESGASAYGFRVARTATATPPTLLAIAPASGPASGGTMVTITGAALAGTTAVTVGGVPASTFTVVDANTIMVVTPPGTPGLKDVAILSPQGPASLANAFMQHVDVPWATVLEVQPDTSVVLDPAHRAAIAAAGLPWLVRDNLTQIDMVLIPSGAFIMGCSSAAYAGCASNEHPVHPVTLTNAFYLGRREVTQAQWTARMGSNPSQFQSESTVVSSSQVPMRPVERVSWDAIAGAGGFLDGTGLRLPTEAEWEYAYRAGTSTAYHGFAGYPNGTGNESVVSLISWNAGNSSAQTRPVGQLLPNGFGLFDMSGNVAEWVHDWYSATSYPAGPVIDPPGPASGTERVLRGGSWLSTVNVHRSSTRFASSPGGSGAQWCGFRVARSVP